MHAREKKCGGIRIHLCDILRDVIPNNTIPRVDNPIIQRYTVRASGRSLRYDTRRIIHTA